jgi:hypothetical protein
MAITNGYCTLEEIRDRLTIGKRRNAATISFTSGTKTIADTALGLGVFPTGARIRVQGSTNNNGYYTVATGGVAGSLVVSESLTTEAAGASVTITDVTDVADDYTLEQMVEAISRAIEAETHRRFYTTANDETRYYSPDDSYTLMPDDDVLSVTTLATDEDGDRVYETTWAAADYELWPYNAALDGKPYLEIRATIPVGTYVFPILPKAAKVVGKFGYSTTTPAAIREAVLLTAEKLFKRKDAIFGIVGSAETGELRQIMKDDPQVALLLGGFTRLV